MVGFRVVSIRVGSNDGPVVGNFDGAFVGPRVGDCDPSTGDF